MALSNLLLIFLSLTEVILLCIVIFFFWRLRQSEAVLSALQSKQEELLNKLRFNAQLEQELVSTFEQRQAELANLDAKLEDRAKDLNRILREAEKFCRSPQFLREVILTGYRSGKRPADLARATGLSLDEVELIIDQSKRR